MGKNNRQRRKEKASKRTNSSSRNGGYTDIGKVSDEQICNYIRTAATASLEEPIIFEECLDLLVNGLSIPEGKRRVDVLLAAMLDDVVEYCWENGWQPADLVRIAQLKLGAPQAAFAKEVISAEARHYDPSSLHPDWSFQLDEIDEGAWRQRSQSSLLWAKSVTQDVKNRKARLSTALQLLGMFLLATNIPVLLPPPIRRGDNSPPAKTPSYDASKVDKKIIDKIRGLLAKAESTEFEEEAAVFMSKAQELITRYSIDHLPPDDSKDEEKPIGRRFGIDNPYASGKAVLLGNVAVPNHCKVIWSPDLGFATVFGFRRDIEMVELLYASLLVQGTKVLNSAGSRKDKSGKSRTRSFRQSFWDAYSLRISSRLEQATATVEQQHSDLLPVLSQRDDRVEDLYDETFPSAALRPVNLTSSNREGWIAGTAAADTAILDVRENVPASSTSPSPVKGEL